MIVTRSSTRWIGIGLLVFTNLVWVAASELTRYLFMELDFKRPFFFTWAKSCMLSLFLLIYTCSCSTGSRKKASSSSNCSSSNCSKRKKRDGKSFYSQLNNFDDASDFDGASDDDSDELLDGTLTEPEFELISQSASTATDVESNAGEVGSLNNLLEPQQHETETTGEQPRLSSPRHQRSNRSAGDEQRQQRRRRVRFNRHREVRSWPEKLQEAAKQARRPFKPEVDMNKLCGCCTAMMKGGGKQKSRLVIYSLYFAPLWLVGSASYQTALAYSTVSSVNLIAASSPLFVLILAALFGQHSSVDSFNWFKLLMVLMNFAAVCVVSKFSPSWIGSAISLFSAFSNALYLFALSRLTEREERVDMPLLLGTVGIFSMLVCTPLMVLLHLTGIEPQLPLPTLNQTGVLVLNAFLGTLFADALWLYATLLTGSLTSALSGSLAIPISLLFDYLWHGQEMNHVQFICSIPIMISFLGASYQTASHTPRHVPLLNEEDSNIAGRDAGDEPQDSSASTTSSMSMSTISAANHVDEEPQLLQSNIAQ